MRESNQVAWDAWALFMPTLSEQGDKTGRWQMKALPSHVIEVLGKCELRAE